MKNIDLFLLIAFGGDENWSKVEHKKWPISPLDSASAIWYTSVLSSWIFSNRYR